MAWCIQYNKKYGERITEFGVQISNLKIIKHWSNYQYRDKDITIDQT